MQNKPLVVVLFAGALTAFVAGLGPVEALAAFGKTFTANRYLAIGWLVLPVIGVLERAGLRERAHTLVGSIRAASAGKILLAYFVLRQIAAALGLASLGGHALLVRPLVAPMAEAAADAHGALDDETRFHIRAHAAACDNIALFFGEDLFVAIGSILLMKGVFHASGIEVEPLRLALFAAPTAVVALAVHAARLLLLDASRWRGKGKNEGAGA
jgi:uncharacterized membrane protein